MNPIACFTVFQHVFATAVDYIVAVLNGCDSEHLRSGFDVSDADFAGAAVRRAVLSATSTFSILAEPMSASGAQYPLILRC